MPGAIPYIYHIALVPDLSICGVDTARGDWIYFSLSISIFFSFLGPILQGACSQSVRASFCPIAISRFGGYLALGEGYRPGEGVGAEPALDEGCLFSFW